MRPVDAVAGVTIAGLYVLFVVFFAVVRGRAALRENALQLLAIAAGILVLGVAERALETSLGPVVLLLVPVALAVGQVIMRARRNERLVTTASVPGDVVTPAPRTAIRVFIALLIAWLVVMAVVTVLVARQGS